MLRTERSRLFHLHRLCGRKGLIKPGALVWRHAAEAPRPRRSASDPDLDDEVGVFRRGRWLYRVTEPLITFYEVVMRPEWYRLEPGHAEAAWPAIPPQDSVLTCAPPPALG
ncbi:MAG TPA: hypothetical protein VGD84_15405 [Pseudonocardiaceae bacterium]